MIEKSRKQTIRIRILWIQMQSKCDLCLKWENKTQIETQKEEQKIIKANIWRLLAMIASSFSLR